MPGHQTFVRLILSIVRRSINYPDINGQTKTCMQVILVVKALVLAVKKTPTRQVTKATFDKWQQDIDRDHQTLAWLRCELERDNIHLAFLFCDVCKRNKDSIVSMRNFQVTWITGTTNQKKSVVIEHASSEIHIKGAMGRLKSVNA